MEILTTKLSNGRDGDPAYRKVRGYRKLYLGADPASARDLFALALIEDVLEPSPETDNRGVQMFHPRRLTCRWCETLPPGTSYEVATDRLIKLRQKVDHLFLDANNVGRAVSDAMYAASIGHIAVYTTSGNVQSFSKPDWQTIRISKERLMTNLLMLLQTGTLKLDRRMENYDAMRESLATMQLLTTVGGHTTISGKQNGSDDLALALAYAALGADFDAFDAAPIKVRWG